MGSRQWKYCSFECSSTSFKSIIVFFWKVFKSLRNWFDLFKNIFNHLYKMLTITFWRVFHFTWKAERQIYIDKSSSAGLLSNYLQQQEWGQAKANSQKHNASFLFQQEVRIRNRDTLKHRHSDTGYGTSSRILTATQNGTLSLTLLKFVFKLL